MSDAERPDLDAGYGRKRRSRPPAEDDRDPVDPPKTSTASTPPATPPAATGAPPAGRRLSGERTLTEDERYRLTRQLGLQVSLAHHEMIEAIAKQRVPPYSKKRYVLEDAIQVLYDREIGGTP